MRLLLALATCLALAAPARAQQEGPELLSVEEIVAAVRALDTPETFARLAEGFGVPDSQRDLYAAHLGAIFADDRVAAAFATDFATEQGTYEIVSREELTEVARSLAVGWAGDTATLGVARLSPEDRRAALTDNLAVLDSMAAGPCAAGTRGALDPVEEARAEIAWLAGQDDETTEAHLARSRAAIIAEIADDPPYVPLDEAEERRAGQAYQEAVLAALDAHPLKPLVLQAVQNFDMAPDEAVCELTRLSLRAALGIEGETGDLVLRLVTSG